MTNAEQAEFTLKLGIRSPYDLNEAGHPDAWHYQAARGVLADLMGRRAIKWALGDIDPEVRVEIVQALAEIILAARKEDKA